jgi:ornithine cyclodeaminase
MLTDIRTAIAGLISAKYLGPDHVENIGIIGSGGQARLQLEYLTHATNCRTVKVWNRNAETAKAFAVEMGKQGFDVALAGNVEDLVKKCNLIVTTTPSSTPLIRAEWIQKGTHITAVGADAPGKQEIDEKIVKLADIVSVDSYSQCKDHGEIAAAFAQGLVNHEGLIELGKIIDNGVKARTDNQQITLTDLTGVAVQDIKIALCVYKSYMNQSKQ